MEIEVIMVGYGATLLNALAGSLSPKSVAVLEEPDIIPKRGLKNRAAEEPVIGRLISSEYIHRSSPPVVPEEISAKACVVIPALEYSVVAAALLAEHLGVPGAGSPAAHIFTDKIELRRMAEKAGIPGPRFAEVRNTGELSYAVADLSPNGKDLVLKPANRAGSVGVEMFSPSSDLSAVWARTTTATDAQLVPNRELSWRYLVEERMEGAEVSVECLVVNGIMRFVNLTDKITAGGVHPVELGHIVPGPMAESHRSHLVDLMERLIRATGFCTGILHAEWFLTPTGPGLVECAARIPGDRITDLISHAYDQEFLPEYLTVLRGSLPQMRQNPRQASAIFFLQSPPGQVLSVQGVEQAATMPGVQAVNCTVVKGQQIQMLRSSWDRVGSVLATGNDAKEALHNATTAAESIRIEVK